MSVVNLTPHVLSLQREDGTFITVPASGTVARCEEQRVKVGAVAGLAIYETSYGNVTGLPDPQPGTVYVVSALVAKAAGREDVLAPGQALRDEAGVVVGAIGLSRVR